MEFFGLVHLPMYIKSQVHALAAKLRMRALARAAPHKSAKIQRLMNKLTEEQKQAVILSAIADAAKVQALMQAAPEQVQVATMVKLHQLQQTALLQLPTQVRIQTFDAMSPELANLRKKMRNPPTVDATVNTIYAQLGNVLRDSHASYSYYVDSYYSIDDKARLSTPEQREQLVKVSEQVLECLHGAADELMKKQEEARLEYIRKQAQLNANVNGV